MPTVEDAITTLQDEIANAPLDPMVRVFECDCEWEREDFFHEVFNYAGEEICPYCYCPATLVHIDDIEDEIEALDNVIKAAESWSTQYEKDPESHAGLIKAESRLERLLRGYFRGLPERILPLINWYNYETKLRQLQADDLGDIEVIIDIQDGPLGQEDAMLIQLIHDPLAAAVALGALSGETVYQFDLGITETSATVQRVAREMVAELVRKKIDKDGNIVPNPKAKYHIHAKTRQDIRESIRTSLSLGETKAEATARIMKTISNPKRAEMIARTETVNAYQKGLLLMGDESGAVGKQWLTVNTTDVCGSYASLGIVDIKHVYDPLTGIKAPAAHPNCRCSIRLVYPEEMATVKK